MRSTLQPGAVVLDRYEVLELLGSGGMGEVYLVLHRHLQRQEALKVLHADVADHQEFVARFKREARAAARLRHPGIVALHEFGELGDRGGHHFLTMEYAAGELLHRTLGREGALPVPRALHLLVQLADALEHAHGAGVIHRDLKPENLMLTVVRGRPDVLKIIDFGISKIVAPDYRETHAPSRFGVIFGTPPYMAPEQALCEAVDARTDLYALGCIAFQLLTGELLFDGVPMAVLRAQVEEAPTPPSARNPAARISRPLDDLVLRCLEKRPERRFQSAAELRAAITQSPGFSSQKTGSTWRRMAPGATVEESPPPAAPAATLRLEGGGLATQVLGPEPLFVQRRNVVVREAAEALLDSGHRDFQLLIGVAELREIEGELERIEGEAAGLEAHAAEVEQVARQREAPLRMALSDLQAGMAGGPPAPQLAAEFRRVEARLGALAEELAADLGGLEARALTVAIERSEVERRRDQLLAKIEPILDEILPTYSADPRLARLAEQLRMVRLARG